MKQPTTIEIKWIKALTGESESEVLIALHEIRNSGSVSMLPYIIDLLYSSHRDPIKKSALQLIGDIKTQEAVPYLIESINHRGFGPMFSQFLSACWQSGLDFSAHLHIFTNIFIKADYQTALEAFTVIEESLPHANDDAKISCLIQLKSAQDAIPDDKLPLFMELIKMYQNL